MIHAFKARRPWVAAAMAFLLAPQIGLCYLGRGKLALAYIGFIVLCVALMAALVHFQLIPDWSFAKHYAEYAGIGIGAFGAVHCFRLAKRADGQMPRKWYARWYSLLGFVTLFHVAPAVAEHCCAVYNIPSAAMSPAIEKGKTIVIGRRAYVDHPPQRGDVAVFRLGKTMYVKRVVGLPGDRIQMRGGALYLNRVAVPRVRAEDYALPDEDGASYSVRQYIEFIPGGGSYRILDEMPDGEVDDTQEYLVPAGHYFMLGDNRDQSLDSRYVDRIGFIPAADLLGKVWGR